MTSTPFRMHPGVFNLNPTKPLKQNPTNFIGAPAQQNNHQQKPTKVNLFWRVIKLQITNKPDEFDVIIQQATANTESSLKRKSIAAVPNFKFGTQDGHTIPLPNKKVICISFMDT